MRTTLLTLTALLLTAAPLAAGNCGTYQKTSNDIIETAVEAGTFNTLATALKAAGLVDALKGDGPYTVFAPTDEAFAKLPAGTVESLLKPENRDQLTAVLTYHVVPGKVKARQVVRMDRASTLNGQVVDIRTKGGKVMVDDARVIKTDITASNGVIHVVDSVLLPNFEDIVETARKAGSFATLLKAATAAGLVDTLKSEGPFTLFAPTDEAFAKVPSGTLQALLRPENRNALAQVLTYHVIPGRIDAGTALEAGNARTVQDGTVKIRQRRGSLQVNEARIVKTDVDASNGIIHVIDSVLIPSGLELATLDNQGSDGYASYGY